MTTSRGGTRSRSRSVASRLAGRVGALMHVRAVTGGGTTGGGTSGTATGADATAGNRVADRGDVPGWVLVTLMTAGLVSALWIVAGNALVNLFETAISHVAP